MDAQVWIRDQVPSFLLTQAGMLHDCSDTQFLHLQIGDNKSYGKIGL